MARNRYAGKHPSYKKRKMSKKQIEAKRKYDKAYSKTKRSKNARVVLNRANRKAGTYGNGDRKDMAHSADGKRMRPQSQSKNRANNRPKVRATRKKSR
jgi:hypothetical protein